MAEFATDSKAVSDIGDRAAMGKKLVGTGAATAAAAEGPWLAVTKQRHPAYERSEQDWLRWRAAYLGGEDYVSLILQKHHIEKDGEFKTRRSKAVSLNFLGPICDAFGFYLFAPDEWNIPFGDSAPELERDADMRGTTFKDFMRGAVARCVCDGHIVIGVDSPHTDQEVKTVAELNAANIRAYLTIIDPADFLFWQCNAVGQLTLAMHRAISTEFEIAAGPEPRIIDRNNPEERKENWRYYLWDLNFCRVISANGMLLEEIPNTWGCVPFVVMQHKNVGDPVVSQGIAADIEPLQGEIVNLNSLRFEEFRHCFSQLVLPGEPDDYLEGASDASKQNLSGESPGAVLGRAQGLNFKGDTTHAPAYITPATQPITEMTATMVGNEQKIYNIAGIRRDSKDSNASGVAKAWQFSDTNQTCKGIASQVVDAMRKILAIAAKVHGKDIKPGDINISPPSDYAPITVAQLIETAAICNKVEAPPEFTRKVWIMAAQKLDPKDADLKKAIEAWAVPLAAAGGGNSSPTRGVPDLNELVE